MASMSILRESYSKSEMSVLGFLLGLIFRVSQYPYPNISSIGSCQRERDNKKNDENFQKKGHFCGVMPLMDLSGLLL